MRVVSQCLHSKLGDIGTTPKIRGKALTALMLPEMRANSVSSFAKILHELIALIVSVLIGCVP